MEKFNSVIILRVEEGMANVIYDYNEREMPIDLPDGEYVLDIEFDVDYLPAREAPAPVDDISLATPPEDAEIENYEIANYTMYNEDGEKIHIDRSTVDYIVNSIEDELIESMLKYFENE